MVGGPFACEHALVYLDSLLQAPEALPGRREPPHEAIELLHLPAMARAGADAEDQPPVRDDVDGGRARATIRLLRLP